MTNPIDKAQPEALRLAAGLEEGCCSLREWLGPAAAELRRLQNALEMAVSDAQRSWTELATQAAQIEACRAEAARPRDLLLEFFRLENAPRHQCTCDDRDEWDKDEHHEDCPVHEDLRNFERMDEIMTLLREAVGQPAPAMKEKTP